MTAQFLTLIIRKVSRLLFIETLNSSLAILFRVARLVYLDAQMSVCPPVLRTCRRYACFDALSDVVESLAIRAPGRKLQWLPLGHRFD
jgi:hypothetical protein